MKKLSGMFLVKVLGLVIIKDIIESFGDLFFKKGAISTGIDNILLSNILEFAARITTNPWLWIGIAFYLINFFLWIILLSRVDLSVAFPISSFTYIFVPILAIIFLHEQVPLMRWAGIVLIITGITLTTRSTETTPGTGR